MHDASNRSQRFSPRVLSVARFVAVATVAGLPTAGAALGDEPSGPELERWVKLLASPELGTVKSQS